MRRRTHRRSRSQHHNSSDSDGDDDDNDEDSRRFNMSARVNKGTRRNPKLPPFTGKETWKVCFNRFEEITKERVDR